MIVESAVEYLHGIATELRSYINQPALLLEKVMQLDEESLKTQRENYRNQEKSD
ncbi:hypothetical protein ACI2OX_03540 [Bacillus sp. N9]